MARKDKTAPMFSPLADATPVEPAAPSRHPWEGAAERAVAKLRAPANRSAIKTLEAELARNQATITRIKKEGQVQVSMPRVPVADAESATGGSSH